MPITKINNWQIGTNEITSEQLTDFDTTNANIGDTLVKGMDGVFHPVKETKNINFLNEILGIGSVDTANMTITVYFNSESGATYDNGGRGTSTNPFSDISDLINLCKDNRIVDLKPYKLILQGNDKQYNGKYNFSLFGDGRIDLYNFEFLCDSTEYSISVGSPSLYFVIDTCKFTSNDGVSNSKTCKFYDYSIFKVIHTTYNVPSGKKMFAECVNAIISKGMFYQNYFISEDNGIVADKMVFAFDNSSMFVFQNSTTECKFNYYIWAQGGAKVGVDVIPPNCQCNQVYGSHIVLADGKSLTLPRLDELDGFDTSSLADGKTIIWDATNNKFVAGDFKLVNLEDFDATNLADGKTIIWDATNNKFVAGDPIPQNIVSAVKITQTTKAKSDINSTSYQLNVGQTFDTTNKNISVWVSRTPMFEGEDYTIVDNQTIQFTSDIYSAISDTDVIFIKVYTLV